MDYSFRQIIDKLSSLLQVVFLLATVPAGGVLIGTIGGEFILPTGSPYRGVLWAIFAFLVIGTLLWISWVKSPEISIAALGVFYLFAAVTSQYEYLEMSRNSLYRAVQADHELTYPASWRSLERNEVYRFFIADALDDPGASDSWFNHLRAQASIGHVSYERTRKYTGSSEVLRQGWLVWWGWFCQYALLLVGTFFGMAGPIARAGPDLDIASERKPPGETDDGPDRPEREKPLPAKETHPVTEDEPGDTI